jgi:uncharacterized protein (UPF0371 family)
MGRFSKAKKYKQQREELINKMIDIIDDKIHITHKIKNIKDLRASYLVQELHKDKNKLKLLNELIPEVKKYFITCNIGMFRNPKCQNPYRTLINNVLKQEGIKFKHINTSTMNGFNSRYLIFNLSKA